MKTLLTSLLIFGTLFAQDSKLDSLENIVKNDPRNIDAMFELAVIYYDMVSKKENDSATGRAEELFESILQIKEDHTEAMVYYGSLLTIMGRDAFMPWDKLSYVEEGCELMDKAIRLDPQNIRLRIRRAMNNIKLPDSFDRKQYYLADFEFIRNHPAFLTFKPDFQQQLLYYSAIAFEKNNETNKSIEMYQRIIKINKDTGIAQLANKALKK